MDIGSVAATPLAQPQASALGGMQDAQARVADASAQIASGNLDPAVVLDLSSAQVDFAANATVLQASQDNSRHLIDMLA
ncbi:hypothetical protein [Azospirillum sp. TSO35-2]|uniref:hypothetical protein n=1 Tax=Azospirillum sp. TSO35-2 TaxID=716796 RepID=UPI000D61C1CF|nr:hypothetical protein [Azospirillum sp. TSO35-2]PWC33465.1 hypothetical protein TSO352_23680 [Azospirillum sp. TSO35-2]